jgi:hypothetical protein
MIWKLIGLRRGKLRIDLIDLLIFPREGNKEAVCYLPHISGESASFPMGVEECGLCEFTTGINFDSVG